jgi:hypothetical protein
MFPYVPDPSWFDAHWYKGGEKTPRQLPSAFPALIALGCSIVLAVFVALGGFGHSGT